MPLRRLLLYAATRDSLMLQPSTLQGGDDATERLPSSFIAAAGVYAATGDNLMLQPSNLPGGDDAAERLPSSFTAAAGGCQQRSSFPAAAT